MKSLRTLTSLIILLILTQACKQEDQSPFVYQTNKYEDLVSFFKEWREFQKPDYHNGVPDYTVDAMQKQKTRIPEFMNRL